MKTIKPLLFFPGVMLGTSFGRQYFKCTGADQILGNEEILPTGATLEPIAEVLPKRWLVKVSGRTLFRFVGIDDVKLTDGNIS
jgi:hypothetical protein